MLAKAKGFISPEAGAIDACELSDVGKVGPCRKVDYFLYFYWVFFLIILLLLFCFPKLKAFLLILGFFHKCI